MKVKQLLLSSGVSRMALNSAILFGGNMAVNVFAYLYHVVVGRILGPSQYGELAALLSMLYIVNVPSEVIRTIAMKFFAGFYAKSEHGQAKHMYMSLAKYLGVFSVIVFVALFFSFREIGIFLKLKDNSYFFWLYLMFVFQLYAGLNTGVIFGYQKFVASTVLLNIVIIARLIVGVLLAPFGVGMALAGNAVSSILAVASYYFPFKKIFTKAEEKNQLTKQDIFTYSWPTLFSLLGLTSLYSMDVVLVKHHFSAHEAGIYSSLAVLGKVIFFASNSIGFVLFPTIAGKWELRQSISKEFVFSIFSVSLISLGLTAVYFIFPMLMVDMLFGADFRDAVSYVGVFGLFLSLFSISSLLMNTYLAIGKTVVWVFMIVGAFFQIVGISFYHANLYQVIFVNSAVCGVLCLSLLAYYPFATKRNV